VSHAELGELVASVRALRAENSRIDSRLEKLEQQAANTSTRRAATAAATVSARSLEAGPHEQVPPLAVVKLKPRTQVAPTLSTNVEVVEPSIDGSEGPKPVEDELALAEAAYEKGIAALKTGLGESGITQLLKFVGDSPNHAKADNALFFVGLAQLAVQDFASAARQFERVLTSYPAGDTVVESMLRLGECRVRLEQLGAARAIWGQLIASFPGTPAAVQAEARLAALSQRIGQE
jgi:TolA-binding protein